MYDDVSDSQLEDAWIEAFRTLAQDYTNRDHLAAVEVLGDELRARGLSPPTGRVKSELDEIARQMRAVEAAKAPPAIEGVRQGLERDLMSFVEERNSKCA